MNYLITEREKLEAKMKALHINSETAVVVLRGVSIT